jgi:hypothetical protein
VDWLTLRVLTRHPHSEILIGIEPTELVESKFFLALLMS